MRKEQTASRPAINFILLFLMILTATHGNVVSANSQGSTSTDDSDVQFRWVCRPSKLVLSPTDTVAVTVYPVQETVSGTPPNFTWTVSGGSIDHGYPSAQWSFDGQSPGPYTATIRIEDPAFGVTHCTVDVYVDEDAPPTDISRSSLPRETGSDLLQSDTREKRGYGLYTYLLLAARPGDQNQEKYERFIKAFLDLVPEISRLERYIPPSQLNVAYLPVTKLPPEALVQEDLVGFILAHYDYARSRAILRLAPGDHRNGPYIISALSPITGRSQIEKPYIDQDLTLFPAEVAENVVKEYLLQAAREEFYKRRALPRLALNMQATVHVLANAKGPIEEALKYWLKILK